MTAVAIAGTVSAVALPSFESAVQRARRADALVAMMQIQLAQDRLRSSASSYGGLAEIAVAGTSPAGSYRLHIDAPSPDGYAALATAIGLQARDAACRHLQLRVAGGNAVHASGPDASVANPDAANRRCWSL